MRTLQEEFSQIEIGRSSEFRNLILFPLVRRSTPFQPLDYLLLEEGIAQGKVRATELHAGGSVPELHLENNADLPVLLVDGEELVGAKQNRVLNLTILAPANHTTVIPVSCVEAGRWRMESMDLKVAEHVMYSLGRGERVTQVTASMRSNGTRKSDQGAVWRNIAAKATRLKASSPTGAMSAIYERHASSVEEFARAFTWQEGQCGVAFAIGGRILGLEMFDYPEVMCKFFQKLGECSEPAAESLNTPLLAAERMPAKSRLRLENAAAGVGSPDLLQGRIESGCTSMYSCVGNGNKSLAQEISNLRQRHKLNLPRIYTVRL